jgi:hypothetical protein
MLRLFVALLTLLSLALAQQSLVGRASVVDGDTLEIQGVRVRLWGIDAVESSQTCLDAAGRVWPCGRRAAFALADFLGQRTNLRLRGGSAAPAAFRASGGDRSGAFALCSNFGWGTHRPAEGVPPGRGPAATHATGPIPQTTGLQPP